MLPLLILAVAVGAFVLLSKQSPTTPVQVSGLTPDQIALAVRTALAEEPDPNKLDEFANACQEAGYADYANQLHARANLLRQTPPPPGGGQVNPPPPPPPQPQPVVTQGPTATTLWNIQDFQAAYPDAGPLLDDSTPPHGLQVGQKICFFFHTTAGGNSYIAVPGSVDDPDPNATVGYALASVDEQVPGGPPPGTHIQLSTTDESDMYLDEGGQADPAGRFLSMHSPPPPGVMT